MCVCVCVCVCVGVHVFVCLCVCVCVCVCANVCVCSYHALVPHHCFSEGFAFNHIYTFDQNGSSSIASTGKPCLDVNHSPWAECEWLH